MHHSGLKPRGLQDVGTGGRQTLDGCVADIQVASVVNSSVKAPVRREA
jgi:hypothetical protein